MPGNRTLQILVVTNMCPTPELPMSGIFVAEQVESLRQRGLSIDVLFVNGKQGQAQYLKGFGRVRQAVAGKRYDLIHAHYVFSGILSLAQRRVPVVLTHHGIETQQGWTAPLCRWTSRQVDVTIATSSRVSEAVGLPGVHVVPCGIDTDLFRPLARTEARRHLGMDDQRPAVLFAGMRRPEKRFDLVEEAMRLVCFQQPDVQLIVADNEPHVRMPYFMNACDALVLASDAEGSPMVVKEAMACNLPVVSVDVGDVREIIGNTPGCAIVEQNANALAEGLLTSLALGGRTDGRSAIMALSLPAIAERLEGIYRTMLSGSPCSG